MEKSYRPSLGRMANLGQLFDARTEQFLPLSIFRGPIPSGCISSVGNNLLDYKEIQSESIRDKFSEFKLDGESKVSLLGGLFGGLEGAGKYLTEATGNSTSTQRSLLVSMLTFVDSFDISDKALAEHICIDDLKSKKIKNSTHVVCAINWGANMVVHMVKHRDIQKAENSSNTDISGSLNLDNISLSLTAKGGMSYIQKLNDELKNSSVKIYGDVCPPDLGDMNKIIESFPALVKQCNDGKGKPIRYGLIHLASVQEYLDLEVTSVPWTEISDEICTGLVSIFDQITQTKMKFTDKSDKAFKKYSDVLSEEQRRSIQGQLDDLATLEISLREDLKKALLSVRNSNSDPQVLLTLRTKYGRDNDRLKNIQKFWANTGARISFKMHTADELQEAGIPILQADQSVPQRVRSSQATTFYVLHVSAGADRDQKERAVHSFCGLKKRCAIQGLKVDFLFVDCELFLPPITLENPIEVHLYVNEKKERSDVDSDQEASFVKGKYKLIRDNGFGEYLTKIGVGGPAWYAMTNSNVSITISMTGEWYTMDMETTAGKWWSLGLLSGIIRQEFKLGVEFDEKTPDGHKAKSTITKHENGLKLVQKLSDGSVRTTIRTFTKDGMDVTLESKGATCTRYFKRIN